MVIPITPPRALAHYCRQETLEQSRRILGSVQLFLPLPSRLKELDYCSKPLGGPSVRRCILSRHPVRWDRVSIRAQVMTHCGVLLRMLGDDPCLD